MTAITKKALGVKMAEVFINTFIEDGANVYIALSHVQPWANDAAPDSPQDNRQTEVSFWRGLFGGKKLTAYDMVTGVPRVNWTANTVYTQYSDNNPNIFSTSFYVLTSDFNVYKCIGNDSGAPSTVMPTYVAPDRTNIELDGYTWKFLYTLTTSDRIRFLTDQWMPCRYIGLSDGSLQYQVEVDSINGSIDEIAIANNGIGYTNTANLLITITGDGSFASATGNINVSTSTLSSLTITNPGSGYHYANVSIEGGGGFLAAANVIITPFGGTGYNAAYELGASAIIINTRIKGSENGKITTQNDYRQVALLDSPIINGTLDLAIPAVIPGTPFSNSAFSQVTQVFVSSVGGNYSIDEYVYQGSSLNSSTFSGRVVNWDSGNNVVAIVETQGVATTAQLIGLTSGSTRFLTSVINPDLQPYVGNLLYIDNITPIQRNASQTDDLKFVILL